jgi:elongation factor 1-beta
LSRRENHLWVFFVGRPTPAIIFFFWKMPGLKNVAVLNEYLADKSYIEGYQPSAADAVVFEAHAPRAPDATQYKHAARWYKHISSFGEQRLSFPGERKALSVYGPAGAKDDESAVEASAMEVEATKAPAAAAPKADADDDIDLFGSDEEVDEDAERLKKERVAAYEAKRATKPVVIAKSSLLLDVKPWDDETDLKAMEAEVRRIQLDGLMWGASKLVPVAFGVKKLQIMATVEDDKVSVDWLEEQITGLEDYVQSMDIAAFNKI